MTMNASEITAFLNRMDPALLGVIATIDATQYPTTIPVWYRYEGEVVSIWTTTARAWPSHILARPKVSFAVMETEPPFSAVLIKGQAELVVNGGSHWSEVRAITERYIAPEEIDAYIAPWSALDTMCVIHPEKVVSWKRGY